MAFPFLTIHKRIHNNLRRKCVSVFVCLSLGLNGAPAYGLTAAAGVPLPAPGTMVEISPAYQPMVIQGLTLDPGNPLQIDFLVNQGDTSLTDEQLAAESRTLIKYFLTALTVPEDRMWVNLSPYEADRIIPAEFGKTEMGRELLAQDYLLKQLSASLMYPEKDLGKDFWHRVHAKALQKFGTTDIPMNTFNKVWIVPEKAVVHREGTTVMVVDSRMKVLLEEDYAALRHHALGTVPDEQRDDIISGISADIVREVLIPEIENEVNSGRNFARLRQIYQSLILAVWYKQHLRDSLLGRLYIDRNKTGGITQADIRDNERIYRTYVSAFERGVYNYIREDVDPVTEEKIPRKYFSGGVDYAQMSAALTEESAVAPAVQSASALRRVRARLDGLGDKAVELRQLARGEGETDQSILVERILPNDQVAYLQEVWRRVAAGGTAIDAETASEIEIIMNSRADQQTRFFAVAGNWMRMLDRSDEIVNVYAPHRQIDLDSPSNMFQFALEKILHGFHPVFQDEHLGIMIVRVQEYETDRFRFDTILMDHRGDFFTDNEAGTAVPIEQVLSSQVVSGPRTVFGDDLAMAVLASDRFSVLTVKPNGADISEARYWESRHYLKRGVELGQRRFRNPPVREGTVFVMTSFMRKDAFGNLKRDFDVTDSAALAEEELPFNQGIQQVAGWLGLSMRSKPADKPLVIVLHGRHGAGKTVTKDLIVQALEEFGYRLDPDRRRNGSKTIHRYNAWRVEDMLEEAWANNFHGHTGIVIVETVEKPVPREWRQADNLLFVHLRAEESRRRKRIESKGAKWAKQLDIKAVHETGSSLKTFLHRVSIENSGMDINKLFNGTMRFQNAFEQALADKALLAVPQENRQTAAASVSAADDPVGGIDLNPANMNMEFRGDTGSLRFSIDPALLQDISVEGFVPVILNVSPVTTLPLLIRTDPDPDLSPEIRPVQASGSANSPKISRR